MAPTCPACAKPIPLTWRLGFRKSWGACPKCGMVLRESAFRKLACESIFLLAVLFICLGHGWLPSFVMRGAIGLAAIILAAVFLPGFELRDDRHKG